MGKAKTTHWVRKMFSNQTVLVILYVVTAVALATLVISTSGDFFIAIVFAIFGPILIGAILVGLTYVFGIVAIIVGSLLFEVMGIEEANKFRVALWLIVTIAISIGVLIILGNLLGASNGARDCEYSTRGYVCH